MGRNSERVARANHKTNKRMSIFRYTQVRSYKTVPNDFFVELKRYFVTQGFKIKRFQYTETSGQMVGRKDGWHLNFVPKFVLDIKQVHGVHFITFNYFARVRKIGIASGIATQGITALIGAATITGYLVAARNLVDAVGRAMDALAGNPLSVEWVEKEEAGEDAKTADPASSTVTYNTTNIQNVGPEPTNANNNIKETNTVVEHHHHYYYAGQNEQTQQMAPRAASPVAVEEPIVREIVEAPQQRLSIMPSQPSQPAYRQSDLEKELISMLERGDGLSTPEYDMPAANPFMGGANASVYDNQINSNNNHSNNNQYRDVPSPQFFSGGAYADAQTAEPAHNPFTYEDNTQLPQYNLPVQHAPLYSIEPLSYNKMDGGFRLDELREIAPAVQQPNPFFVPLNNNAMKPQQRSDDPFADLSLENVAGAYGMKTHTHQPAPITTGEYGYARN